MPEELKRYKPGVQYYKEIANLQPWDLLLTGNSETLDAESRCGRPIEGISRYLPTGYQHIKISRQPDRGADGKFIFNIDEERKEISAQDFRSCFEKVMEPIWGQCPVNVLMDITSLELDTIIHLQSFFHQPGRAQTLFAMYTSPNTYQGRDNYKLRLNEIAQPPGYVSLSMDKPRAYPHVFILGFDKGRALRFFEKFDEWKDDEKYAVIVDPPYVHDGASIAKKANQWIDNLEPEHIFHISALEPFKLHEKLQELYEDKNRLDIIPLGPKLMLLGATRFYFSLSEEERNNVRILYDFPQTEVGDTSDIGKHYLLNCHSA